MLITKKSIITGKMNSMELDITQDQLDEYQNSKRLIQDIFPNLNRDEREFLISGATKEEWDNALGTEE